VEREYRLGGRGCQIGRGVEGAEGKTAKIPTRA